MELNYFEPFNSCIELEKMKLNPEGEVIMQKGISIIVIEEEGKSVIKTNYKKKEIF
ncbi:MAG: hypothetical protein V1759_03415 [bacterium]